MVRASPGASWRFPSATASASTGRTRAARKKSGAEKLKVAWPWLRKRSLTGRPAWSRIGSGSKAHGRISTSYSRAVRHSGCGCAAAGTARQNAIRASNSRMAEHPFYSSRAWLGEGTHPQGGGGVTAIIVPSESQRLDPPDPGQRLEAAHHLAGDMAVDRHQGHRLAARLAPAEVEGADIDSGLAQGGAEPADEAGPVLVDDVDHLAGQFGLDRD